MGSEIFIVSCLAIIVGCIIGYILCSKLGLLDKLKDFKMKKITQDPEKLKELLEANGEIIDKGKKIVYKVEEDENGKKILKQHTEELKIIKKQENKKVIKDKLPKTDKKKKIVKKKKNNKKA